MLDTTINDNYNILLYLKSKTNMDNDMAFLIEKGEYVIIDVPADVYELYVAKGTTWFGNERMFGPKGIYLKEQMEYTFEPDHGYVIKLNHSLSLLYLLNLESEWYYNVGYSDFPKL